jgi:integrase/recombinase XerC
MRGSSGDPGRPPLPASAWALVRDEVVHLDPQEGLWQAMRRGWEIQQQARMLSPSTVKTRLRSVDRFFEFAGEYPWRWQPSDVEAWSVELRHKKNAHSTIRSHQNAIALFCDYLVDPRYGWGEISFERFGSHPVQVCHEWNTARHVSEFEGRPEVRPFTRAEVQQLFDYADDQVERAVATGRKGSLAAFRDSALLKTIYAYGLRRAEALGLGVTDFYRNPKAPELREFGSVHVRYGKASKGSPPRRRTVLTYFPWAVEVLEEYLQEVRPLYGVGERTGMWPTERGGWVTATYLKNRFNQYLDGAGLDLTLHLHALRHSYVTHLIEDGVDPYFVQRQVGHVWASTTAIYAGVSSDYMNTVLRQSLDRAAGPGLLNSNPLAPLDPGATS